MSYQRIARSVYGQPWAVLPATLETIQEVLAERTRGEVRDFNIHQTNNHFSAQALSLAPPRSRDSRVYRRGAMAYVPVSGVIGKRLSMMEAMCGGYNIDQLAMDVEEVMADSSVKNVLFDYDSPGGQVQGVPETAKALAQLRVSGKKTYSFTATQAASAAYWLYAQADHRYLTESAMVGSVGVIVAIMDRTEQLKQQGIKPILVKAGAHKGAGLPGNPMSEEQLAMVQAQVDMFYGMMKYSINTAHSGIDDASLQGQTFLGLQAIKAKMADGLVSSLGSLVQQLS